MPALERLQPKGGDRELETGLTQRKMNEEKHSVTGERLPQVIRFGKGFLQRWILDDSGGTERKKATWQILTGLLPGSARGPCCILEVCDFEHHYSNDHWGFYENVDY